MKTRRCGSSSACVARQACLRAATSGRSCSLACAVFFERHGVAIEEAPNHALCKSLAVPTLQMAGNLRQRDVARRGDQPEDLLGMGLDPIRALVATLRAPRPAAPPLCSPYRPPAPPTSPPWPPRPRTDPPQPAGSCQPQPPRSVAHEGRSTEVSSCRLASSASPQHESPVSPPVN